MARTKGLTDGQLAAMVRSEIDDAVGYDESELSLRRRKALDYFNGNMPDVPAADGRSSVTSHDLSDAIGWIMPGLMRVFASGDRVADYEPQGPGDEEAARQATDYINHVFMQECDGYRILYNGCMEALKLGNGLIKHWWDDTPTYHVEDHSGLSDDQYALVLSEDDIEVLQHSEETVAETVPDPMTGEPVEVAVTTHDVKIRRVVRSGCLKVESLPPEEFLIERNAKSIEDANFVCHRRNMARADLIAMGFPRRQVMSIGSEGTLETTDEFLARWDEQTSGADRKNAYDPLMEEVEVFEAYIRADYDGDDHPEWRRVMLAGSGAEKEMLANEEWGDPVPFSDLCAMIQPHRWEGRSLLDELEDVQKVKTVLMRQTLDNLYLQNHPQKAVLVNGVHNPDELVNPTLGGVIWEKQPGAVREIVTPFVAANSAQMLAYFDEIAERRTGVSRQSMALDPETLQNQTAQGVATAQSAAYAKIELYARNIAVGLRRVFKCLLRLAVKHQDKARVIRLRGKWVEMDPRGWNADMDAVVNVGLGSGSRDRDIMMLMQILAQQKEIMGLAGPFNPIAGIDKAVNTLRKIVETAGMRNADAYFAEVSQEDAQAWMAENMGGDDGPPPEVQVEMMKAQAQIQLEQQKAAMAVERERAQMEADLQVKRAEIEADTIARRQQMDVDQAKEAQRLQFEMQKLAATQQIEREKMAQQRALELMKMGVAAGPADENGTPTPSVFDGMAASMADAMGRHSAEIAGQLSQMMAAQTATILKAMSAPKRVVRGPDGRTLGVETVME